MKYDFLILKVLCLLLIGLTIGFSQTNVAGNISYVSKDNAYANLGKQAGIMTGDTLRVSRGDTLLGVALVTQSGASSSALIPIDSTIINWEIGDQVSATRLLAQTRGDSKLTNLPPDTLPRPVIRQVFLDSSAYQSRVSTVVSVTPNKFKPAFNGYVSARFIEIGGDSTGLSRSTGSVNAQFSVRDLGLKYLNATVFLRSSQTSTDTLLTTRLYSFMLDYARPGSRFSYQFGRLYHPQFSMLGTVDGGGLTWQGDNWLLGVLAGQVANFTALQLPNSQKAGIIVKRQIATGDFEIGNVIERSGTQLSRNFLFFGSSWRPGKTFRLRSYAEFDLDLTDASAAQSVVSLTRVRSTAQWHFRRSLRSSLRYSYRSNVIDLTDTSFIIEHLAPRHTLNGSLSWYSANGLALAAQAVYRTDGSGRSIETLGLNMSASEISPWNLDINAGLMAMLSYVSQGGRLFAAAERPVLPWLQIELYDELFAYQIRGDTRFRLRHLPELGCSLKLPLVNRLRFRMRLEQEDGITLHRFSLSASRQL